MALQRSILAEEGRTGVTFGPDVRYLIETNVKGTRTMNTNPRQPDRGSRVQNSISLRPALHVGAVQYLNTKPLVHGLASGITEGQPPLNLTYDLPSRLADRLQAGTLDVALIPIVEVFRGGWRVISDVCIGCRGPVMSVKLFFRTAPERVTRIALDEGSRTSAALAQVLLYERFGVRPEVERLPIGSGVESTDADAVLLIGDRAIGPHGGPAPHERHPLGRRPGSFQLVWDLGDEWCRWTGLPFVFAVWAARGDVATDALEPQLMAARDRGVANLAAIAAVEASRHGLTVPQCLSYLRDNLHYQIGPLERDAIRRFQDLTRSLGLLRSAPSKGAEAGTRQSQPSRMLNEE